MARFLALALCLLAVTAFAEDEAAKGALIVQKVVTTEFPGLFAKDTQFNVTLNLYNVGSGSVYNVEILDPWPLEHFTVHEGETSGKYEEIAAGGKVQHNFTLSPNIDSVEFPGFAARFTYLPTVDGQPQAGSSTPYRNLTVLPVDFYKRVTASHTAEWSLFFVFAAASFLLPLIPYLIIQNKYVDGLPKAALKDD